MLIVCLQTDVLYKIIGAFLKHCFLMMHIKILSNSHTNQIYYGKIKTNSQTKSNIHNTHWFVKCVIFVLIFIIQSQKQNADLLNSVA